MNVLAIGLADIVTAFDDKTIGTKVVDWNKFDTYLVDAVRDFDFNSCIDNQSCRLFTKSIGYTFYTHSSSSSDPTNFYRLIKVYPLCDLDGSLCSSAVDTSMVGVKVVSTVKWPYKSDYHEVVQEEYLYNWR